MKLVALRINQDTRSCSQFQKGWLLLVYGYRHCTPLPQLRRRIL